MILFKCVAIRHAENLLDTPAATQCSVLGLKSTRRGFSMKTTMIVVAYIGWLMSVSGIIAVVIDLQPMLGSKFTYDLVIASALVSVASSGVWLCFNEQEKK
jgi:hypothetical protein